MQWVELTNIDLMGKYFNIGLRTVRGRSMQKYEYKFRRALENGVRRALRIDASHIRQWMRDSLPVATGAAAEGTRGDVSTPGKRGFWRLRFFGGRNRKSQSIRFSRLKVLADLVPIPSTRLSPSAFEVYKALYPHVYAHAHIHTDEEVWKYWYVVATRHSRVADILLNQVWTKDVVNKYSEYVKQLIAGVTRQILKGNYSRPEDSVGFGVPDLRLPIVPRKPQERNKNMIIGMTIRLIPDFFKHVKGMGIKSKNIRERDVRSFIREKFKRYR